VTPNSDSITNNLPGLVLLILIIAVPLAFFVSIGLLGLYRRAVLRTMGTRANIGPTEPVLLETSTLPQEPVQTPLNIVILEATSSRTASSPEDLYTSLLRAPWRAAAIYVVAGLCYALVMTIVFLAATQSEFYPLQFLIPFWYYAWPVVVTICLVAAATWRTRFIVVSTYFLMLVPLGAIARSGNSVFNWGQIALLWLLTNFLAAVVLLAFLNRRVRAVGPLVLTFVILAVTGSLLLPFIVGNDRRLDLTLIRTGRALGLNGNGVFIGLFVLGFLLFGVIGWLMLQWIGDWYKQKKISEQSITMDAIWLLFGVFQSIGLFFEGEIWFLTSLLSFVVYKIISWAGFSWLARKTRPSWKNPNLLLLRVFSLGKRSERLFDLLGMHWRYVGNIRLIAGPDLATTTMEPHEFLDFLSGKLARRFIDSAQTFDLRISEMDVQPDRDGQFRVNDFFCYEDTWKMVLSRLAGESHIVLMDLRGFSSLNAGCVFEISELINAVPLGQVLFIIDETTDEQFLRQIMKQSWDHMRPTSPNRQSTSRVLSLFRLRGLSDKELRQLLNALSIAAQAIPKTQEVA
jgi:hypothetical protein